MITWFGLLDLCPEFRQWEREGRQAARNSPTDWWPAWLPTSRDFLQFVQEVAGRHGLDVDHVRGVALRGLLDTYRTERRRSGRSVGCVPSRAGFRNPPRSQAGGRPRSPGGYPLKVLPRKSTP